MIPNIAFSLVPQLFPSSGSKKKEFRRVCRLCCGFFCEHPKEASGKLLSLFRVFGFRVEEEVFSAKDTFRNEKFDQGQGLSNRRLTLVNPF